MTSKRDNFSEWYNEVIEKADLTDKRYPIKGMDVWRPYGRRLMKAIDQRIDAEMGRTGHDEVEFPLLIPQSEFNKEAEQIKGFGGEVYWVTKGGDTDLDVPLVVRPTSETAMYPMFSLWIRSHKDLPLKIYQIVSVFRYETKQTRSFLRVRQIHFFEAHTAHKDYEDAERQIHQDIEIWANLAADLCLPYMLSKRPDWDKFPGAFYSIGADVILPGNIPGELRALQVATIHHYRENFSKPYDIKYEAAEGGHKFAHQTTYGMSERLVGALVGVHGDDKGLMLPPALAPIQVAIVPVLFKGKEGGVVEACRALAADLAHHGVRAHVDERAETAGYKYNDWEMRGVPIRIELGPRDIEKKQCVVVRRDNAEKKFVPLDGLAGEVRHALDAYAKGLTERAWAMLNASVKDVAKAADAKPLLGLARVGWCGDDACGKAMEDASERKVLGTPVEMAFGESFKHDAHGKLVYPSTGFHGHCANCGKPTTTPAYLAKSY
ncbi:MAG: proline--tRNA ligase [Thermoplasmatota archaeon]